MLEILLFAFVTHFVLAEFFGLRIVIGLINLRPVVQKWGWSIFA
jgi:hypothetical protein